MRLKAYSVYLLYKICFSLLFSMATVLSLVYYSEVVGLNALQLVLVGTVLLTGLMRSLREPVLTAWMNAHVEERMRATVFSTSGQLDALGQIIGGPIVGIAAQQGSVSWGLACTALLLLPALLLVPAAGRAGREKA